MSRRYLPSVLVVTAVSTLLASGVALAAVVTEAPAVRASASTHHHKTRKRAPAKTSVFHDRATGTWYYAFVFSSPKPVASFTVAANKLVSGASYEYRGTQTGCAGNVPPTDTFSCSISSGPGHPPIPAGAKIEAIYTSTRACGAGGMRARVMVNAKTISITGPCRKTNLPI